MQRPLIAVSADIDELLTAFGNIDCTKLNAEYTNAIYAAGGQPMILPLVAEPPTELLTQMDGLLLTVTLLSHKARRRRYRHDASSMRPRRRSITPVRAT